MPIETVKLQAFLDALRAALLSGAGAEKPAGRVIHAVFEALDAQMVATNNEPLRLPVCRYLDTAFATACKGPALAGRATSALQTIEPMLTWSQRPGAAAAAGPAFADGHANANIVGHNGLVQCRDVQIGISLLAPNLQYPDHQHPPEEVYLALSNGDWRQSNGPWHEPGMGGVVYNSPNVVHAMHSRNSPLFAVWCLP